ncbi:hypothetical protein [Saccharopolyspora taberi]|uniref:hypothetical protein n=1 Tax=Saccharopolyspora taberi TaxID=60895 RepID=UPI0031E1B538
MSTTTSPTGPSTDRAAYWICPRGSNIRHATDIRPGALINGSAIKALGGCAITIPMATPNDQQPRSRLVNKRCPDCAEVVEERNLPSRDWDF